jgi:hypothetical protein
MMRLTTMVVVVFALAATVWAAEGGFAEPILLTSCGQSADVLMLKTLLNKDSLKFSYLPNAGASDVDGKGAVIVVLGGSSKGLGAAKISAEQELARVTALLEAAQKSGLAVLAVHMGGMNRRGALSDPFNILGAESATRIFVVKGGDDDGLFTKMATEKKIPITTLKTALEVGHAVNELFRPAASQ